MLTSQLSHCLKVYLTAGRRHIHQKLLGKASVLNIGKDLLHSLLCILCNNLWSGDVITVLGCIGDGITHSRKAGLVDQIYNQLHLMDTLKVCILRIISCLHQRFKSCLHQGAYAAAENCLLAKEVCFRFCAEGGLKESGSCSANGKAICQRTV